MTLQSLCCYCHAFFITYMFFSLENQMLECGAIYTCLESTPKKNRILNMYDDNNANPSIRQTKNRNFLRQIIKRVLKE